MHSHVERVDRERVCLHTVSLNDGHVVVVDRDMVRRAATEVDEPEAVPLALLHGGDGQGNLRTSGDAALSVDGRRVSDPLRNSFSMICRQNDSSRLYLRVGESWVWERQK